MHYLIYSKGLPVDSKILVLDTCAPFMRNIGTILWFGVVATFGALMCVLWVIGAFMSVLSDFQQYKKYDRKICHCHWMITFPIKMFNKSLQIGE